MNSGTTKKSRYNKKNYQDYPWWCNRQAKIRRENFLSNEFDKYQGMFFTADNEDTKKYCGIKMLEFNVELEDMSTQEAQFVGNFYVAKKEDNEGDKKCQVDTKSCQLSLLKH